MTIVVSIMSCVTHLTAIQLMLFLLTQVAPGQNPLIFQCLALNGATVALLQMLLWDHISFLFSQLETFHSEHMEARNVRSILSGIKGIHGWSILKSQILCFVSLVVFLQKDQEGLMRHLF